MKNKLNRKNIVAAAVMVFCAAVAVWGGAAYADEIAIKENPMSGLAAVIASKFNLSESAVQAVFDEQMQARRERMEANRKEMETKRREQFEDRLNNCLLYTSDAADDLLCVDLGGRRIIKKKKI